MDILITWKNLVGMSENYWLYHYFDLFIKIMDKGGISEEKIKNEKN